MRSRSAASKYDAPSGITLSTSSVRSGPSGSRSSHAACALTKAFRSCPNLLTMSAMISGLSPGSTPVTSN